MHASQTLGAYCDWMAIKTIGYLGRVAPRTAPCSVLMLLIRPRLRFLCRKHMKITSRVTVW